MRQAAGSSASNTAAAGQIETIGRALPAEPYPQTEQGWRDRYHELYRAYEQGNYSDADVKREHLFSAKDDDGKEIDVARRLFAFFRFIVDVDTRALLGPKGLMLEVEGEGTADAAANALQAAGEAVWRRSRIEQNAVVWATICATTGDYWLEAVRTNAAPPFDTKIVGYPPEWVTPTYDEMGVELLRVEVSFIYMDAVAPDAFALSSMVQHSYRRVVDKEGVEVFRDGKSEGKRPHNLGVVPMGHCKWKPWMGPEHSLPAAHGLDAAVSRMNSFVGQVGAISNRYADPKLFITGATVGAGSDLGVFGRVISTAKTDADAKYLEAGGQALGAILDVIKEVIAHVRDTAPEFLFADASASESGTARSYKASALEMKIAEARSQILPAIAEVTGMAVAMDDNAIYRHEAYPFCVEAAPFIRPDVDGEVQTLVLAAPWLMKRDIVKRLQRLGLASSDMDVDAYLTALEEEKAMAGGPTFSAAGTENLQG